MATNFVHRVILKLGTLCTIITAFEKAHSLTAINTLSKKKALHTLKMAEK